MKKRRVVLFCILGIALLSPGLILLCGCSSGESVSTYYYGGSDPKGDFVSIVIDKASSRVKHINYSDGETAESQPWYSYTTLEADDEYANGFSIIKKATLSSTEYVLIAEFPGAAAVYQMFKWDELELDYLAFEDPRYVVYRQQTDKSSYYEKAYNWMKFFIDTSVDQSDMSAGFAAFDTSGEQGLLYGAGWSKKDEVEGGGDGGVSDINSDDSFTIDSLVYHQESVSNIKWGGSVDDWTQAIAVTGTASGALVLDFGSATGGGMGLAVPQATTSWSNLAGTYFTMVYEFDQETDERQVFPMKIVIKSVDSEWHCQVYPYDVKTSNPANAVFNQPLDAIGTLDSGPYPGETIAETFLRVSDCASAASSIVQNGNLCNGSFIAMNETDEQVVVTTFDSTGRFLGFTMFDDDEGTPEADYVVRFGLGIRDTGYTNNY